MHLAEKLAPQKANSLPVESRLSWPSSRDFNCPRSAAACH